MLMDPLVSALNGSQTLVSQASCPELCKPDITALNSALPHILNIPMDAGFVSRTAMLRQFRLFRCIFT